MVAVVRGEFSEPIQMKFHAAYQCKTFFEILKLLSMGMVFIIGKSGSGKSTLLNVLKAVGLDKYDQRYPDELSGGHIVSDFTKYCDVILQIMLKNIEKYVII